MKLKKFDSQTGISLIEVLVVITVAAVLVTIAVAKIGNSKNNL